MPASESEAPVVILTAALVPTVMAATDGSRQRDPRFARQPSLAPIQKGVSSEIPIRPAIDLSKPTLL